MEQQKKMGSIPQKLGLYRGNQNFRKKSRKSQFQEIYYLKFATQSTLSGRHD